MTTRERFRRVMAGDAAVDRLPAIEWAYWWDKTLELWYGQGLPRGLDEAAMADFVGIDRNTQFWLPHKTPDCPRETSHGRGIVENESDYERLRPYLLPENAVQQMLPKIRQTLPFYENGQTLAQIPGADAKDLPGKFVPLSGPSGDKLRGQLLFPHMSVGGGKVFLPHLL